MTKDQVISLFVLANGWNPEGWPNTVDELQRFAVFVEDQVREQCAKVCLDTYPSIEGAVCAQRIRARKQA